MASEIAQRADEVVRTGVAPLLKEQGFRKKGRTFHKIVGEAIQVVNVQVSRWSEGNSGQITVSLGVYFRGIAEMIGMLTPSRLPAEIQCTVRIRLGHLLPNPADKWWAIRTDKDNPEVAAEVGAALEAYGLPWLELVTSRDGLRQTFRNAQYSYFDDRSPIAFELLEGNRTEAVALFEAMLKDLASSPFFAREMSDWGREHGLI